MYAVGYFPLICVPASIKHIVTQHNKVSKEITCSLHLGV
jgi:hypothetical protein